MPIYIQAHPGEREGFQVEIDVVDSIHAGIRIEIVIGEDVQIDEVLGPVAALGLQLIAQAHLDPVFTAKRIDVVKLKVLTGLKTIVDDVLIVGIGFDDVAIGGMGGTATVPHAKRLERHLLPQVEK